jgi:hypothetical protein
LLSWHVSDQLTGSGVESLPERQEIDRFRPLLVETFPWRQGNDAASAQRVANVLWGQIERAGAEHRSVARGAAGATSWWGAA